MWPVLKSYKIYKGKGTIGRLFGQNKFYCNNKSVFTSKIFHEIVEKALLYQKKPMFDYLTVTSLTVIELYMAEK